MSGARSPAEVLKRKTAPRKTYRNQQARADRARRMGGIRQFIAVMAVLFPK